MSDKINYDDLDGATSVSRKHAGLGARIGMFAMFGVAGISLLVLFWPRSPVLQEAKPTDDEFRTTQFHAPSLPEGAMQTTTPTDQIVVPVPDDEKKTAQADNTEQTVVEGDDLEAQRRAYEQQMALADARRREAEEAERVRRAQEEAERQAAEAELRRKETRERLASGQMVLDSDDEENDRKPATIAADGQLVPVPGADSDPNKAFLAQSENSANGAAVAVINRRTDALVAEGTLIGGFLETAVNTDLPGMVRAVVRDDVYSLDGRRILIPKGSRLIGEYKSGLARGQKRVYVVWNRIIRADGVSVRIGSPGTDNLGRGGMAGAVDTHWLERYGNAIMLSIVGGASEYISSLADNKNSNQRRTTTSVDPVTGAVITTEDGGYNNSTKDARAIAFEKSSASLQQLANDAFKDSQHIGPTIYIDQGTPILVFLRRDLDFSALYADPVQEELARLKRGGKRRQLADPTPLYLTPKDNFPAPELSRDYFPPKP